MRLLKLEVQKLLPYRVFWIFGGLYLVLFVSVVYILGSIVKSANFNGLEVTFQLFEFPQVWSRVGYVGSFLHYLLSFLVILSITNEFDFLTFRQQLMDGLSRRELLAGKVYLILMLSIGASIVLILICLTMGTLFSPDGGAGVDFEESGWVIAFGLQSTALLSIAAVFAFLIRRPAPTIGAFLLYALIGEAILGRLLDGYRSGVSAYLPISSINRLMASPFDPLLGKPSIESPLNANFGVVLLYLAILGLSAFFVIERRSF